jgi:hypothetical protein
MSVWEDSDTVRDIIKISGDESGIKTTIPGYSRGIRIVGETSGGISQYNANVIVDGGFDINQTHLQQDLVSVDKNAPLNKPQVYSAGTRIHSNYVTLFDTGIQKYELPPLNEIVEHETTEMAMLDSSYKRWSNPRQFKVGIEQNLFNKRQAMIEARR